MADQGGAEQPYDDEEMFDEDDAELQAALLASMMEVRVQALAWLPPVVLICVVIWSGCGGAE